MKKFLSLVLALVMTMSLVTVAGAAGFTDDADVNYDEAVDVISALGIVGGYPDGSFNPEGPLTRGAAAKIICNMLVGPDYASELAATSAPYSDVPVGSTYAGYIAYCANEGIVGGYADGTFKPGAPLNGYAFLKMLLGVVGYDADIEKYSGANYQVNVLLDAKELQLPNGDNWSLLENLDGKFNGNATVTREEACLYAFNALQAKKAFYQNEGDKITIGDIEFTTGASAVSFKNYDVASVLFEDLYKDTNVSSDALKRPAHAWAIAVKNDDDIEIGTYADTADLVLDKYYDADDFADAIEDADLEIDTKEENNVEVAIIDNTITANGKTVEFFDKDDDGVIEANEYVEIAPYVVDYADLAYFKDKVSTKDKDERYVTIDGLKVVADKDVIKGGVELDNFEALYDAISEEDDELKVLVIEDKTGKAYSVEILEAVEADITRVKSSDKQIVADGEVYDCAYNVVASADIDEAKLYIAGNGVVYAIGGVTADVSDVIYVSYVSYEENKWGEYTVTAQIVTEDYEIAEVILANDKDANDKGNDGIKDTEFDKADADAMKALKDGYYTYEVDDDEYTLTAKANAVTLSKVGAMDEDKAYVYTDAANKSGKLYFAADMVVVYIGEKGTKDLEVTVKEGVQDEVKGDFYVKNSDGKLAIVYVEAAYSDGESDDVIFLADGNFDAYVKDLEGDKVKAYDAYIDGEKVELPIAGTVTAGFWTYEIDADTGVYSLKTSKGYSTAVGANTITEDTYVTVANVCDDAVVTGEIYDLTDEGLYTLKSIDEWDGSTLTLYFMYDKDENEITALYVK